VVAVKNEKYIPALSYDLLTPLYDPVVRLTTRENAFKKALIEQARIEDARRVLDLACGTGTLTVMIKTAAPQAAVVGIDGDRKILKIAVTKAKKASLDIRFDEGLSFALPYPDESFDRVFSSLFFHHLTRKNKLKTLGEVKRILKPRGEFHVADFGQPANFLMRFSSVIIKRFDSPETTADNFNGLLPKLIDETGFEAIEETNHFNSAFGTIRLHKSRKT
jgi:ubiquinone/menaquinone biosynthesis C-methylase UbiE